MAVALAAVAAALSSVPAARADAGALLERYRPALAFDSDERYLPAPVDGRRHRAARGRGPLYGHAVRDRGRLWLQYWIFYAYNPQDRGIVRTGRHEGDWELVQFRLRRDGVPDLATLAQHHWAEGCAWRELRTDGEGRRRHPLLFVANGSHAVYSRPGKQDRPFPDPDDEADARGPRLRPSVDRITDRSPAWVVWPGRWGASDAGLVPGEAPSPPGPRFQEHGAWSSPAAFHAERSVPCGSGPPAAGWQLLSLLPPVLLIALVVALRRRAAGRRSAGRADS